MCYDLLYWIGIFLTLNMNGNKQFKPMIMMRIAYMIERMNTHEDHCCLFCTYDPHNNHMCYFYRVERILTESINLKYHWCWLPSSIFILLCFHRLDTLIWARMNASFISEGYYQIWFAVKIRACPNLYNLWSFGQVKKFKRNMKLTEK